MHPEALCYLLGALWSINERLGGEPGESFAPFDANILLDAYRVVKMEADAMEEDEDDYRAMDSWSDPRMQMHKWGIHGAW